MEPNLHNLFLDFFKVLEPSFWIGPLQQFFKLAILIFYHPLNDVPHIRGYTCLGVGDETLSKKYFRLPL